MKRSAGFANSSHRCWKRPCRVASGTLLALADDLNWAESMTGSFKHHACLPLRHSFIQSRGRLFGIAADSGAPPNSCNELAGLLSLVGVRAATAITLSAAALGPRG